MLTSIEERQASLGASLRKLRETAGLQGKDLAVKLGLQPARVSRIEKGKTKPRRVEIAAWCQVTNAGAEYPRLEEELTDIEQGYLVYADLTGVTDGRPQLDRIEREKHARVLRLFQPLVIPGLLQTRDYATVVFRADGDLIGHQIEDVRPQVTGRIARQDAVLNRDGRRFHAVMLEEALQPGIVPADVMTGQIRHLLDALKMPLVRIGIVPAGRPRWTPLNGFMIFDDEIVEIDTMSALVRITSTREVDLYRRTFAHFEQAAVHGTKAKALLTGIHNQLAAQIGAPALGDQT